MAVLVNKSKVSREANECALYDKCKINRVTDRSKTKGRVSQRNNITHLKILKLKIEVDKTTAVHTHVKDASERARARAHTSARSISS